MVNPFPNNNFGTSPSSSGSVTISSGGIQTPQSSGGVHTLSSGQNATIIAYIDNTTSNQEGVTVQYVVGGQMVTETPFQVPANTTGYRGSTVLSWNKLSQYGTGDKTVQVRFPSYSPHGQQTTQAGTVDIKKGIQSVQSGGNVKAYTMNLDRSSVGSGGNVKFSLEVNNNSNSQKGVTVDFYYRDNKVANAVGYVPANTSKYPVSDVISYNKLSQYGTGSNPVYAILKAGGSWPRQKVQGGSLDVKATSSSSSTSPTTTASKPSFSFTLAPRTDAVKVDINGKNPNSIGVNANYKVEIAPVNSSGQALNGKTVATPTMIIPANGSNSFTGDYAVNGIPTGGQHTIQVCVYQTGFSKL